MKTAFLRNVVSDLTPGALLQSNAMVLGNYKKSGVAAQVFIDLTETLDADKFYVPYRAGPMPTGVHDCYGGPSW